MIADLHARNRVVKYAKEYAGRGLVYKAGAINWDDMIIGVVADASHAEEIDENSGRPYRSQGGKILILATPSLKHGLERNFHVIVYSSSTLKRVCRATYQAETYR